MESEIGIFGGSGLYSLFEKAERTLTEESLKTPYGKTSGPITIGTIAGRNVAFMPRHGLKHQYPPHKIPYKANVYAFKELGVRRIIAPCAVGSLQPHIKPGDFVICDQFVDRTHGRDDTFFNGPEVRHIAMSEPFCPEMRRVAIECCKKLKLPYHNNGTCVVINGPRFSTKAESRSFASMGWAIVNMTQYPEVVLAKELGMCYVNVSIVTDYDAGLEGRSDVKPVTAAEVSRIFHRNIESVKRLINEIVAETPRPSCWCSGEPEKAKF